MDTTSAVLLAAVPTVVASFAVGAVSRAQRARDSMGERVGDLESWRDREIGRREGYAEGYAAAQREAARAGRG